MGIGDLSIVQNLQQHVQHIGVGLLNFVEEDDGVRFPANLLCQLPRLVIAYVTRWGAHDPGDGVLFHKLRHIQANQGVGGVEKVRGQLLHQLRFPYTGGAYKNEAYRLVLGGDAHPVPANSGGDSRDGLILANDMVFQALLKLAQTLELLLPNAGGGNLGPQLNDVGQILHGQLGLTLLIDDAELRGELEVPAFQLRHAGVVLLGLLLLLLQHGPLLGVVIHLPLDLHPPGNIRVF